MPGINADEIITQKHKRNFIQWGGARPENPTQYAGQDAQYMFIDGVTLPETGGVDPINVPDPRRAGKYKLVGRSVSAPDLPTATLVLLEKHGSIPRQLQSINCLFTVYEQTGNCQDLADFVNGWTDYVLIYSSAEVTDKDLGTRSARDSDDVIEDSLSITLSDIYPVGALGFGEEAANEISKTVVDVVYGSVISCNCKDATSWIYAVTETSGAGSPGLPAELIYTTDGGDTWTQTNITGFGATESPVAIDIVGQYLVILSASDALYYAEINKDTGVPGTFTKVTTGFSATGSPTNMYVASPREIWICGDAGYLYKSTDITAGVTVISAGTITAQNLTRIDGIDETIVTVGAAGVVVKSVNRGTTWATTTASPSANTNKGVAVLDYLRYWVVDSAGDAWYTLDGGASWTEKSLPGSSALTDAHDVVFVSDEVGYIAANTVSTGYLFCTWDGGYTWTRSANRVMNFPTVSSVERIAIPDAEPSIAANNVALGCISGGGTDGVLLIGAAGRL